MDFAAEQAGKFAADGKSQTGSAVFTAGTRVCLLESLEDNALFFEGDADSGIRNLECDDRGCPAKDRVLIAPATGCFRNTHAHSTVFGELEGVRQQILEHLLQTLRVCHQAAAEMGIRLHLEGELPVFRFVAERTTHHLQQAAEEYFFGINGDRAGFNLREIENVADQVEQVGSRSVNGAGKFHLLRREVSVRVVAQLLAQHENAVERSAQLVRHVGQELRLVLGCERELFCLLFESAPGLLDFLVLAFHFDVLLGQLLSFLRELFVGLLQFFLLRLQLDGQLLRLFEQAFRLHRSFNTVEHDADAGG